MCELLNIRLGWVLSQGTEAFADLLLLDLSIASVVEQVEGFLKFYESEENKNGYLNVRVNFLNIPSVPCI